METLLEVLSPALPSTSDNHFLKVTGRYSFKLQVLLYKLQLLKYFWHTLLREFNFVCNVRSLNCDNISVYAVANWKFMYL